MELRSRFPRVPTPRASSLPTSGVQGHWSPRPLPGPYSTTRLPASPKFRSRSHDVGMVYAFLWASWPLLWLVQGEELLGQIQHLPLEVHGVPKRAVGQRVQRMPQEVLGGQVGEARGRQDTGSPLDRRTRSLSTRTRMLHCTSSSTRCSIRRWGHQRQTRTLLPWPHNCRSS